MELILSPPSHFTQLVYVNGTSYRASNLRSVVWLAGMFLLPPRLSSLTRVIPIGSVLTIRMLNSSSFETVGVVSIFNQFIQAGKSFNQAY